MGELYPPTAADYASYNAQCAEAKAKSALTKAESLEVRVARLEAALEAAGLLTA
jgi:hypothetical protein